jgi:nitrogen fixation protein FixH
MDPRFIPWLFAAGMAFVVAVNGALIYFATATWSGLSVERAYEKGLAYNRALAAAARQEALGWRFAVRLTSAAGATIVVVEATDRDGKPVDDLHIEATLERPVEPGKTAPIALQAEGQGHYAATMDRLRPGQWDARLVVSRGADTAAITHREIVK